MIKSFSKEESDNMLFVDMCEKFPYKQGELWEGLHFSKLGYEDFGEKLAIEIKDYAGKIF